MTNESKSEGNSVRLSEIWPDLLVGAVGAFGFVVLSPRGAWPTNAYGWVMTVPAALGAYIVPFGIGYALSMVMGKEKRLKRAAVIGAVIMWITLLSSFSGSFSKEWSESKGGSHQGLAASRDSNPHDEVEHASSVPVESDLFTPSKYIAMQDSGVQVQMFPSPDDGTVFYSVYELAAPTIMEVIASRILGQYTEDPVTRITCNGSGRAMEEILSAQNNEDINFLLLSFSTHGGYTSCLYNVRSAGSSYRLATMIEPLEASVFTVVYVEDLQ